MKKDRGFTITELLLVLAIILIIVALFPLFALWTDRTLDFWFSYFKGQEVNIPYWLSLIITIILNGVILIINIISELIRIVV